MSAAARTPGVIRAARLVRLAFEAGRLMETKGFPTEWKRAEFSWLVRHMGADSNAIGDLIGFMQLAVADQEATNANRAAAAAAAARLAIARARGVDDVLSGSRGEQ